MGKAGSIQPSFLGAEKESGRPSKSSNRRAAKRNAHLMREEGNIFFFNGEHAQVSG
jgi:hypothetical protein